MKSKANNLRASQLTRRRGTVLMMVVALLGLLFIAGAAFLGAVSFESAVIKAEAEAREDTNVIDAVETEIFKQLNRAWLGDDGLPYNNDVTLATEVSGDWSIDQLVDVYGEVPSQHPLIAPVQPYLRDPIDQYWVYDGASDLALARRGIPWNDLGRQKSWYVDECGYSSAPPTLPFSTDGVDLIRQPARDSSSVVGTDGLETDAQLALRDADGDGVSDCIPRRISRELFTLDSRRAMAESVRDPDYLGGLPGNLTINDLFLSLRIVPHSGLASINASHYEILKEVLSESTAANLIGGYPAATEERVLRHRGFLVPPERAPSLLADEHAKTALLDPLDLGGGLYRWWPIDLDADDPQAEYDKWVAWMDISTDGLDRRHLVTTVSYDDNLIRGGAFYNPAANRAASPPLIPPPFRAYAMYPVKDMASTRDEPDPDAIPDEFRGAIALDDADDPDKYFYLNDTPPAEGFDPRLGLLKLSLPSLDPQDLVDDIDYSPINRPTAREMYTVRDAFTLLLRNVDLNGDGDPADAADITWQDKQAAQLAANLFDFVDDESDGKDGAVRHQLTRVEANVTTANSFDSYFGVERQPVITELYCKCVDDVGPGWDGDCGYFIELYNPNPHPIDVDDYRIVVSGSPAIALSGRFPPFSYRLIVWDEDDVLTTETIPTGPDDITTETFSLSAGSVVELQHRYELRPHDPTSLGESELWVVVDRFTADSSADYGEAWSGDFGLRNAGTPGATTEVSLHRFIAEDAVPGSYTAVVPYYKDVGTHHTPKGREEDWTPGWQPVVALTADTGAVATALPTTGSLLLLTRYAHRAFDNDTTDGVGPVFTPFNDALRQDAALIGAALYKDGDDQRKSIDNGHLPLFGAEIAQAVPLGTGSSVKGVPLGVPWGQLVFDYFTALPLENEYNAFGGSVDCEDFDLDEYECNLPTVDQAGLRVHGRVNINAAPWKVLAGVPRLTADDLPVYSDLGGVTAFPQIDDANLGETTVNVLGENLARTIVAYRERRAVTDTLGNTTGDFSGVPDRGFLTIGELMFAAAGDATDDTYKFDSGAGDVFAGNYLQAAARLIALSDWLTNRGHVFTIYGQIRGVGEREAVDKRSIRFQETVDRLPALLDGELPQRIGERSVGLYGDARNN